MALPLSHLLPAVALVASPLVQAAAQSSAAPATATGTASKMKVLNLKDYGRWKRISGTSISPNGTWISYILTANEGGEISLRLTPLDGGDEVVIGLGPTPALRTGIAAAGPRGGGGGGGVGSPIFSDDSKWVTYRAPVPSPRGAGAAPGGGAAAAPGGRGPAPAASNGAAVPATHLKLHNLATGATLLFPSVASSSFSPGSRHLVMRRSRPAGAAAGSAGADLVLHDLATGLARNIGHVGQFAFDRSGTLLAYTDNVSRLSARRRAERVQHAALEP